MKKITLVVLMMVLVGGAIFYFTNERAIKEQAVKEPSEAAPQEEDIIEEDEDVIVDKKEEIIDGEKAEQVTVDIAKGKDAPNFTLKNLNGDEVSLEDYKGKIVLINFWATWCKWCDYEMPDLQRLDKENDDLVILAVDVMEDKSIVQDYIDKGGYEFEVLLDEDGAVAQTYLIGNFPTSYFIDKDGILLGAVPGAMEYEMMNEILENIRKGNL